MKFHVYMTRVWPRTFVHECRNRADDSAPITTRMVEKQALSTQSRAVAPLSAYVTVDLKKQTPPHV